MRYELRLVMTGNNVELDEDTLDRAQFLARSLAKWNIATQVYDNTEKRVVYHGHPYNSTA